MMSLIKECLNSNHLLIPKETKSSNNCKMIFNRAIRNTLKHLQLKAPLPQSASDLMILRIQDHPTLLQIDSISQPRD